MKKNKFKSGRENNINIDYGSHRVWVHVKDYLKSLASLTKLFIDTKV